MEPYLGQIYLFAYNWAPAEYNLCQGQLLQIAQNQALFALIGTVYGGDGRNTIGLPDLRGRTPRGFNPATGIGMTVTNIGLKAGTEIPAYPLSASGSVSIAGASLPGHTHNATFTATTGNQDITIPATAASGGISVAAGAGIDIVPGSSGVNPANSVNNYYLTGVKAPSTGPVTTTVPDPATKGKVLGLNVAIDSSTYQPAVPSKTVAITTVNGGTVSVASNNASSTVVFPVTVGGNATGPSSNPMSQMNPFLALNFSIAVQGLYPVRPS